MAAVPTRNSKSQITGYNHYYEMARILYVIGTFRLRIGKLDRSISSPKS